MSDGPKGYALKDVAEYHCEGAAPPADYNPDEQGYRKCPPGEHVMEFVGDETRFLTDQECHWKVDGVSQQFCLHQLYVKMRVAEGPNSGATIMDFIHVPTFDQQNKVFRPMAAGHANKWANLLKGFGIAVEKGVLWPPGFRLEQLNGKRARVTVTVKMKDDAPVLGKDGQPEVQVKMFGYRPVTEPAAGAPAKSGAPVGAAPSPPVMTSAPKFNL